MDNNQTVLGLRETVVGILAFGGGDWIDVRIVQC